MDKDQLINLTSRIYKATLYFPKKEPLRYKMREVADNILADQKEKDFETLDSFFEVARYQNWVEAEELLAIQKEYDNLRRGSKQIISKEAETSLGITLVPQNVLVGAPKTEQVETNLKDNLSSSKTLSSRQEKILELLRDRGKAQVWEVKQVFPDVTKRTLRRDFESMLNHGVIERMGERNDTFYQVKTA